MRKLQAILLASVLLTGFTAAHHNDNPADQPTDVNHPTDKGPDKKPNQTGISNALSKVPVASAANTVLNALSGIGETVTGAFSGIGDLLDFGKETGNMTSQNP